MLQQKHMQAMKQTTPRMMRHHLHTLETRGGKTTQMRTCQPQVWMGLMVPMVLPSMKKIQLASGCTCSITSSNDCILCVQLDCLAAGLMQEMLLAVEDLCRTIQRQ